jgi:flagellar P-ring protein precursor FlgI
MGKKVILFLFFVVMLNLNATTIREITEVVGVRDNQLIGYGLVVGLNGTGDSASSFYTYQSLSNMLQAMNIKIDPKSIRSKNVAGVLVTAKLPSFTRQGDRLDITVSSIGDAKSLEGGTLVMTPLKGVDGNIYALAQGALSVGGLNQRGAGGVTHSTAGMIPRGGLVERELPYDLYHQMDIKLSLKEPSFTNALNIQKAVNKYYRVEIATALDPKTVTLSKPKNLSMIEFLATVESLNIDYKTRERIIINERTGTIVSGVNVQVSPVMITHGRIIIKVEERDNLPAPNQNRIALDEDVRIDVGANKVSNRTGQNNIANIARSLQKLGAKPKDIISIFQAMKQAGAIQADLDIM